MNIIYARMQGYSWSIPSDAVARELERLGHTVVIVENPSVIPYGKYDFVWSPYESATLLGDVISKKVGCPHFSHIEWLPPWRCDTGCNPVEYGFSGNENEFQNLKNSSLYYQKVGMLNYNSAITSIGGCCFIDYTCRFLGTNPEKYEVRYPSIDTRTIDKIKKAYSPAKNYRSVISVARAVPNKRFDALVKVMNEVTSLCKWVIVGDGPMLGYVKDSMKNSNVELDFKGTLWGTACLHEQATANIFLGSWVGMPPIESALLNTYPVIVEPPINKEGTHTILGEYYNRKISMHSGYAQAAEEISRLVGNAVEEKCKPIVDAFYAGEMGVTTAKENAAQITLRVMNATK